MANAVNDYCVEAARLKAAESAGTSTAGAHVAPATAASSRAGVAATDPKQNKRQRCWINLIVKDSDSDEITDFYK